MATPRPQRRDRPPDGPQNTNPSSPTPRNQVNDDFAAGFTGGAAGRPQPTHAAFSPATLTAPTTAQRRSTILVHQKSPLLLATPPQITRALAYSHPFLLPLNKIAGLLSWTTGDPWESFLMVVAFWLVVLYGDLLLRIAGPLILVGVLTLGMYSRRFSPLSSSGRIQPASKDRTGAAEQEGRGRRGNASAAVANGSAAAGPSGTAGAGTRTNTTTDTNTEAGADSSGGTTGNTTPHVPGAGAGGPAAGGQQHQQQHQRAGPTAEATNTRHQKTLDEMVETLKEFTSRCNILLEPFLELTDLLSTAQTPTSATTMPALLRLFWRIMCFTPVWFVLSLWPLKIVTARRVVLAVGTILLSWHARPCCVARTILWRSRSVRRFAALVTGLEFEGATPPPSSSSPAAPPLFPVLSSPSGALATAANGILRATGVTTARRESELTRAIRRSRRGGGRDAGRDTGVRFTFIIYENQRRWIGLGWTSSLFTYERGAWTDERNNPVPPRDQFELPDGSDDGSRMRWRWVEGSRWRVDGVPDEAVMNDIEGKDQRVVSDDDASAGSREWNYDGDGGKMGWVYYDNKWQNGRRGQDSWGRWTRRRKWYRDAELVEADSDSENDEGGGGGQDLGRTPTLPPIGDEQQADPSPPPPPLPPRVATPTPGGDGTAAAEAQRAQEENGMDEAEREDSVSLLSSSSRSGGSGVARSALRSVPGLRRRVTDSSASSRRSRRTSSVGGGRTNSLEEEQEDTAALLGTSLGLEIQGAGMERDQWGVGDDLRMGLE